MEGKLVMVGLLGAITGNALATGQAFIVSVSIGAFVWLMFGMPRRSALSEGEKS